MINGKRIALVIGWGGVKCAAALGLVKVLQREGIELDLIVATGGGSIFGSLIALGRSVDESMEAIKRLWTKEITGKTDYSAAFQFLLPKWFKKKKYISFRRDELINERLQEAFKDATFADTKIKLAITATNYLTGAQEVISSGSIFKAARATISLPMIFQPVEMDGKLLADGFLSDPIPAGVALKEGADIVLVMGFESISNQKRNSIADYISHFSGILSNNLFRASLAFYHIAHHSEILPVMAQFDREIGLFDVDKVSEIVRAGEDAAEKALPDLRRLVDVQGESGPVAHPTENALGWKRAGKKNPRIGLVIGSGGLKCASAIGVYQALEEAGISVDLVVGCSGGTVLGAAIAMKRTVIQIEDAMRQGWTSDVVRKVDIPTLLKIAAPNVYGFDDRIGIIDDTIMVKNLEGAFGRDLTFADTKIPFFCVATDLNTGENITISEGGIVDAVRVSSGIPMIFKPLERGGRLMLDGGMSNPLPVDVAIQEGADIIIAVGFESPLPADLNSPATYASQMFAILVNQLLSKQFAFYNLAHHSEIIPIIPTFDGEIRLNSIEKIPGIVEAGRVEMEKQMGYLKKLLQMD